MRITVSAGKAPEKIKTPLLAFLLCQKDKCPTFCSGPMCGIIEDYLRNVKGEKVSEGLTWGPGSGDIEHYYAYSPSLQTDYPEQEKWKLSAVKALDEAARLGKRKMAFWIEGDEADQIAGYIAEAVYLNSYEFIKYKPGAQKSKALKPEQVEIFVPSDRLSDAKKILKRVETVCEGVNFARDLINEPAEQLYPETLAAAARKLARQGKLDVTVLKEGELKKQGYNGLVTVGRGSVHPPRMIILRYKPSGKAKGHIGLVGKGITFDTGGISLKPSTKMWEMKGDMSGAAAVLGAMHAIAKLKPKARVTGIVAASHNDVGPGAVHPGDIFIAKNGKSVMVDNTDAEGRLILTDALHRAGEEKVSQIVDYATLTGSCLRALGKSMAGLFANNPQWQERVREAGARAGEDYWPLPLYAEYKKLLKNEVADLNNIGSTPNGGAITAALFLQEFVPAKVEWAHCDIAGVFIQSEPWRYFKPGAVGFGVRTMVNLVEG